MNNDLKFTLATIAILSALHYYCGFMDWLFQPLSWLWAYLSKNFPFINNIAWILGGGIAFLLSITLNSFALSTLWGWFISPTFNIPQLSIQVAMGIFLIIHLVKNNDEGSLVEKKYSTLIEILLDFAINVFGKPIVVLILGAFVKYLFVS